MRALRCWPAGSRATGTGVGWLTGRRAHHGPVAWVGDVHLDQRRQLGRQQHECVAAMPDLLHGCVHVSPMPSSSRDRCRSPCWR